MSTFLKISLLLSISALLVLPFLANAESADKITICHATGSETNPYVEITISVNGIAGHFNSAGDFILGSGGDCDNPLPGSPLPL